MHPLASSGVTSIAGYGTDWLYLLVPLAVYALLYVAIARRGTAPKNAQRGTRTLLRFADRTSKVTGLPPYASAGVLVGIAFLLVAALGFYWDVAWHVDYGRDQLLFTPAHTAILVGLQGPVLAAAVMTLVATWTRADVARVGKRYRAPWGAVVLAALGGGALLGFPIDEVWHRAYGVDVTMWGPTHLAMISGASFAPFALLFTIRESNARLTRLGRRLVAALCAGTLLGFSTWQLEFDLGIPQWQHLYHPVLVALASGFALVVARQLLGPGGALFAAIDFNVQRVLTALLVGHVLHHTTPHWTLYAGTAVLVEIAALATRRAKPIAQALAFGLATAGGLATEWGWTQVWGRQPWGRALLPGIAVAVLAALAAAVLGTAAGRTLRGYGPGLPGMLVAVSGAVAVLALAVPFPRHAAPATATVRTTAAGNGRVDVAVVVDPPSAARNADWFEAFAWQGGSLVRSRLREVAPGQWHTVTPVPVGGHWKTMVRLAKRDVLAAAPVEFPADRQIGASAVPLVPERTVPLERDTTLLMREAHDGAAWPAAVAYGTLAVIATVWVAVLVVGMRSPRLRRKDPLDGARIVVTGALGGIGRATVEALRANGSRVVGLDLVAGPDVIAADVTSAESVRAAVATAAERLGGIDVLLNLAGIGRAQDSGDFPDAEARRVLDINLFGTWNATAAAMPWLVASRGHVVVTASGLATVNMPWAPAYAASKRAVTAYADTLRVEYAGRVSVTVVNPGYVRTPIHEVPAAAGASLEGLVPAEEMRDVVSAYLRACVPSAPRSIATSWRTALAVRTAGRHPGLADRLVLRGLARLDRPAPSFVLSEDELAARTRSRSAVS